MIIVGLMLGFMIGFVVGGLLAGNYAERVTREEASKVTGFGMYRYNKLTGKAVWTWEKNED